MKPALKKESLIVASLKNPNDIAHAVKILSKNLENEKVIGVQFFGVYGLWFNGNDPKAVKWAREIKNIDKLNKPFSSMLHSHDFFPYIEEKEVIQDFQGWFSNELNQNENSIKNIIGALFHLRAPIKRSLVNQIPVSMVGYESGRPVMHNLDPHGHPISQLISQANEKGVKFVAITSLNAHQNREIVNFNEAYQYALSTRKVAMLFKDETHNRKDVQGSFSIIDISKNSLSNNQKGNILREGWLPAELIEKILGVSLNDTQVRKANYPHSSFVHSLKKYSLPPMILRNTLIEYMQGKSVREIKNNLKIYESKKNSSI